MRRPARIIARLALILLCLALFFGLFLRRVIRHSPIRASNSSDRGVVVFVYDGDTVKVRFPGDFERTVRMIGINCPELDDPREDVQLQAHLAQRFAFYHLYHKNVRLTHDWEREDQHGRLLAYVWTEDDRLFNRFILEQGFASAFLKYPYREDYRQDFMAAEREARHQNRGLWQEPPYPEIGMNSIAQSLGRLVTVRYECLELEKKRGFVFLHSSGRSFAALIPQKNLPLFPDIETFRRAILSVSGFLEEFRGQPQIVVALPQQIERIE